MKKSLELMFKYLEVCENELNDYVNFSEILLRSDIVNVEWKKTDISHMPTNVLYLLSNYTNQTLIDTLKSEISESNLDINVDVNFNSDFKTKYAVYFNQDDECSDILSDFKLFLSSKGISNYFINDDFIEQMEENDDLDDLCEILNPISYKLTKEGYGVINFSASWESYCVTVVKLENINKFIALFNELMNPFGISASDVTCYEQDFEDDITYTRCFEYKDDKSNKFWNITWCNDDDFYTITYGRCGTNGTIQEKEADDLEKDVVKIIKSKLKKGYVELDDNYLVFDNINFKLAVIETLCINTDFSYENTAKKRNVDFSAKEDYEHDEYGHVEGVEDKLTEEYEVDIYAIKFFEDLKIPKKYAKELDGIGMEGGSEIYGEVSSYDIHAGDVWEGETDCFDVTDISLREIKQFPNLEYLGLMADEKVIKKIQKMVEDAELDIEVSHCYD